MYATPNSDSHLSRIYPRAINGHTSLEAVCPACQSHKIKLLLHSPELAFKRQSVCVSCGTLWTTRTSQTQIRYKRSFYQ